MTSTEIARQRLINQQLTRHRFKHPGEVVAWLGAVQAQEYALSKWGIGLRATGATDSTVENAINHGSILRTHLLRPTWHFVTPADIRWMLALTAPGVNKLNALMYRKLELDQALFNRCNNIITKALSGGRQLTRTELQTILAKKKIIANTMRLSYIMMRAELDGIICSGPRNGNQFTYALLEERVQPVKKITREEALVTLTDRYFNSRGPATLKDFVTWSGLSVADARHGLELAGNIFTRLRSGEETYYLGADLPTATPTRKAFLLGPYDEYIMGYKNRDDIFYARNKLKATSPASFNNMIVYDGQVVGSWRRAMQQKKISLEYHLWNEQKVVQAAVKHAIAEFAAFINLPATINPLN